LEAYGSKVAEAILEPLGPVIELLFGFMIAGILAVAGILVLLAASLAGIESGDARKARRILQGEITVSEKEKQRIINDLSASDNGYYLGLARRLSAPKEPTPPRHLPL